MSSFLLIEVYGSGCFLKNTGFFDEMKRFTSHMILWTGGM